MFSRPQVSIFSWQRPAEAPIVLPSTLVLINYLTVILTTFSSKVSFHSSLCSFGYFLSISTMNTISSHLQMFITLFDWLMHRFIHLLGVTPDLVFNSVPTNYSFSHSVRYSYCNVIKSWIILDCDTFTNLRPNVR